MGNNLFLSEKYTLGISKIKYLSTTRILGAIALTFIAQFVSNPNGEMIDTSNESGDYYYYSESVVKHYKNFLLMYFYFSTLIICIPALLLENPVKLPCNLKKFF